MGDRRSYILDTNHYTQLTPSIFTKKKINDMGIGDVGGEGLGESESSIKASVFFPSSYGMDGWINGWMDGCKAGSADYILTFDYEYF